MPLVLGQAFFHYVGMNTCPSKSRSLKQAFHQMLTSIGPLQRGRSFITTSVCICDRGREIFGLTLAKFSAEGRSLDVLGMFCTFILAETVRS